MKTSKKDTLTLIMIAGVALIALAIFISQNGFLLPPQESAQQSRPARQTTQSRGEATRGNELLDELSAAFEEVATRTSPSVVPIFSEQVREAESPVGMPHGQFHDFFGDELFRRFFGSPEGNRRQTVRSMGSGVIVSRDGYILTNNHVVADASKLTVTLADGKQHAAKIIGTDPQTDVAVVQIAAKNLTAAALGNSDNVKVGEWVLALGNPFQLLNTVTAGIISAKGRSSVGLAEYEDFIQTDASINPGNSGGALTNMNGEVIGINTAIATGTGSNVGIGFAIPINMARRVMDELIENGKVTRGYLGLLPQDIDENLARAFNLKQTRGALVGDVTPEGPAEKAGIERGDIILAYNGEEVAGSIDLRNRVAEGDPGSTAKLTVLREGKERDITVRLGDRPQDLAASSRRGGDRQDQQQESDSSLDLGLSVQTMTRDLARQLDVNNVQGVLVRQVEPGSAAEAAGIRRGDILLEAGQRRVTSVKDFEEAVGDLASGNSIAMLIRRGDNTFFTALVVP